MSDTRNLPDPRQDRVFDLLPQVIRASDAYAGRPQQALLRVAAEQLALVEDDVYRLLDNWFVETCDEWVLPYLGELLGREPVPSIPTPPADDSPRGRARMRAAHPRRAFAQLVHSRRRKGILLQLQDLARDLTGWPARAVEFRPQVAASATARFPEVGGARTVDLRSGDRLDRADGPFGDLSRRADVRRIGSAHTPGRGNLSAVGLFIWRLKVNVIRAGQARHLTPPDHHDHHPHHAHSDFRLDHYFIDPHGLDRPLFTDAEPLPEPTEPAGELELPVPIRPRAFRDHPARYYGRDKSLFLWRTERSEGADVRPWQPPEDDAGVIPSGQIVVHDLKDWEHSLPPNHPAVAPDSCWVGAVLDVTRGRVLYRRAKDDEATTLWARYCTAFPADIGGGGYFRELSPVSDGVETWVVGGPNPVFKTLSAALHAWDTKPSPRKVVIEIPDDATHRVGRSGHSFTTKLGAGDYLEVRAASHRRPVVRHPRGQDLDWTIQAAPDANPVFVLDGVTLADTTLRLEGTFTRAGVRHSTLRAVNALELQAFDGCLSIESSIVCGTIHVRPEVGPVVCDPITHMPVPQLASPVVHTPADVSVADSILAAFPSGNLPVERVALAGWPHGGGPDGVGMHPPGHIALTVLRTTVFGGVNVHALDLAEDTIFCGPLRVTDTTRGCIRFCSLEGKAPRTPPRHACEPDRTREAFTAKHPHAPAADVYTAGAAAAPRFISTQYGHPGFAQLAADCPAGISRGASDESEMGAFHDLYGPYREALLRAGLAESAPADADATVRFVN